MHSSAVPLHVRDWQNADECTQGERGLVSDSGEGASDLWGTVPGRRQQSEAEGASELKGGSQDGLEGKEGASQAKKGTQNNTQVTLFLARRGDFFIQALPISRQAQLLVNPIINLEFTVPGKL